MQYLLLFYFILFKLVISSRAVTIFGILPQF